MQKKKKKKISDIFVTNKKIGISNWIPPHNKTFNNITTNSWFNYKKYSNPSSKKNIKYIKTIPISNCGSQFISTKKIRLYPTSEQKEILNSWFDVFAKMFNITIHYLRSQIQIKNIDIKEVYKIANFRKIRAILKDKSKNLLNSMNTNKIPVHILDEAINQAVSNYKTCLTNFKNKHIRKFRIREWSSSKRRKIIKIESNYFRNGTFCPRTFPSFLSSEPLDNINKTCTLLYDSDTRKYLLLVPYEVKKEKVCKHNIACGIDLGVRSFATVYSEKSTYSICEEAYNNSSINNCREKIDKINKLLCDNNENIRRTSLKRALRKYHRKIQNKIKDMHYKVSYNIVNTFDNIYIGKLSTSKILSKSNIIISKKTKRSIGMLAPYRFREILKYMGNKYGSIVTEVNEYLTTKTCSQCGRLNELGKSKIHKCRCGMTADRDENAAKNIMKVGMNI